MSDKTQVEINGTMTAVGAVIASTAVEGLPKLLEKAVIKTDQDHIRKSLVKIDIAVHANAVQCMLHAEKHGDTSLMRRLLIDIIDPKSGYRRQGVIAWMKEFSPMRLNGDVISLTGMDKDGNRQPFRVEEANKTPFTELASAREMVAYRPVFKDNMTQGIERAQRAYKAAVENTKIENGKVVGPLDPKKPYYNGIHLDKMDQFFDSIEKQLQEISSWNDSTKTIYEAQQTLKKAELQAAEDAEAIKA